MIKPTRQIAGVYNVILTTRAWACSRRSSVVQLALSWLAAMVMAAAVVKLLMTGCEM